MLRDDFVLGWKNILREPYVGDSFGYSSRQTSLGTTNGAGPHNVQIFVLSPDLVVLHALPGFWHPDDLARELRLGLVLSRLWADQGRTRGEKDNMFARLHAAELARQTDLTTARSAWQHFDASAERRRPDRGSRDTFLVADDGRTEPKPINWLVHERMALRPFVPFEDFDVESYVDYGREFYDNNKDLDGQGMTFKILHALKRKRARQKARKDS